MNTVFTEGPRAGAYIADEASINLSRRVVTIAAGSGVLEPGTVLGKITSSGKYGPLLLSGSTGQQVAAAIAFDHVDASDADAQVVASVALTGVNESELIWPDGAGDGDIDSATAALAAHHIVVLSAAPPLPMAGGTALEFAPLPASAEVDADFGPVHVRVVNDAGHLIGSDNTTSVALAISTGPGTLSTTTPAIAVNGIATFESVALSEAGSVVLTATATGLAPAVSDAITVTNE